MPARHGNHVKAKSKKIQDEAKALGFHGVCTFGKICNKRDCALYHPAGWLKGPDEDEPVVVAPSPAEAADVIARRSRRVVSEGAVNPNFVLAEQKKMMREERIAQNAALASADLLREEGHRRTRKASQRLSESVEDDLVTEAVKKPEEIEAVRRAQEKLALKREQQKKEQEAERAAEEAKIREREQERERLKQEKNERREKLRAERQEAKDKGPEEYEKWCQARRTLSCNSETADLDLDLTQLHPTLSDPQHSDSNFSEFSNGHAMNQQEDQVMFHSNPQQSSEFMTNYTNEPLQQYPWSSSTQVRSRPGMLQLPWTCPGCTYVNFNPAVSSCGQCGAPRQIQLDRPYVPPEGPIYGKPPSYIHPNAHEAYEWNNNEDRHTASEPARSNQADARVDEMGGRSLSTQVHPNQNGMATELPRYPTADSEAMFRSFGQRQHALGNGVFADFSRGQQLHHDSRQFIESGWQKPNFRTVDELLESLNLSCLSSIFSAEDIDLAALKLLKQSHLTDMGIKLGPRVKLMKAIESL